MVTKLGRFFELPFLLHKFQYEERLSIPLLIMINTAMGINFLLFIFLKLLMSEGSTRNNFFKIISYKIQGFKYFFLKKNYFYLFFLKNITLNVLFIPA